MGESQIAGLIQIAVLALQVALAVITWRGRKNGNRHAASETGEERRTRIATAIQTISADRISLPDYWEVQVKQIIKAERESIEWQRAVNAEGRHTIANAVMIAVESIRKVDGLHGALEAYRNRALLSLGDAFRVWRRTP